MSFTPESCRSLLLMSNSLTGEFAGCRADATISHDWSVRLQPANLKWKNIMQELLQVTTGGCIVLWRSKMIDIGFLQINVGFWVLYLINFIKTHSAFRQFLTAGTSLLWASMDFVLYCLRFSSSSTSSAIRSILAKAEQWIEDRYIFLFPFPLALRKAWMYSRIEVSFISIKQCERLTL